MIHEASIISGMSRSSSSTDVEAQASARKAKRRRIQNKPEGLDDTRISHLGPLLPPCPKVGDFQDIAESVGKIPLVGKGLATAVMAPVDSVLASFADCGKSIFESLVYVNTELA